MLAEIQKWGNSAGIRINKTLLGQINVSIGDAVDIDAVEGGILIKPRKELTLEELLANSPDGSFAILPEDKEWLDADPVGNEV